VCYTTASRGAYKFVNTHLYHSRQLYNIHINDARLASPSINLFISLTKNSSFCPDITRNMSYIHSSPNLKTLAITFVNDHTTWYCPQMSMLLSNKILFTGCYFVTFISFVHSHILCVFYYSIVLYACAYAICFS